MSYFQFFNKYINPNTVCENGAIQGECLSMCPQEEIELRIKNTLVHALEVADEAKKMVKAYSRSAAASDVAVPKLLRPFSVLKETVQYLILEVTERTDVPLCVIYDFVNDRLRAVRQDMTIQQLPPEQCMLLLEPMVRFHVYFGYRLSEYPIKDYDPVLNKKYLLECLKWFLNSTDKMETDVNKTRNLARSLSNLEIGKNGKNRLVCNEVLMESLYILCNLGNLHPIYRYLNLSKEMQRKPVLALAYKIALANLHGNFVLIGKLINKTCPLTYCALWSQITDLQRRILQVMSHAYNKTSVPCGVLRQWMLCNSDAEVIEICTRNGFTINGDKVKFSKTDYNPVEVQPARNYAQSERLNLSIQNIFTYS